MRITLAITLLCAALVACGGSSADPDIIGEPFDGLVTVEALGAGEQRSLRYDLVEGDIGESVMTFSSSLTQEFGGSPMGSQVMEYSFVAEYEVTAKTAGGNFEVVTRFIELDADPGLEAALGSMIGMEVFQTLSPRGEILDVSFTLPPGLDPALASTFDQMSDQISDMAAPLPERSVGVGATWSHEATVDLGGFESTMVTSYEVVGFDGDLVLLDIALETTGFDEKLLSPDMPPGMEMLITSLTSTATGMNELDLSRPFMSTSSMVSTMLMEIQVEGEGLSGVMKQSVDIEMSVAPR